MRKPKPRTVVHPGKKLAKKPVELPKSRKGGSVEVTVDTQPLPLEQSELVLVDWPDGFYRFALYRDGVKIARGDGELLAFTEMAWITFELNVKLKAPSKSWMSKRKRNSVNDVTSLMFPTFLKDVELEKH